MSVTRTSDAIGGSPGSRKLIVVVYADMVGYSRLIALDDIGTLERLRVLRRDVIDPAIAEHGGRIVQTGGDSLLITFDSIDGAVRCAVRMQQEVPTRDGDRSPDRTVRFRVGINIGDAIAEGTDLHGDAVNVAVRLEAECLPGAICVTRAVRDHMRGRADFAFEALGALRLKNIPDPVEAFVLKPGAVAKEQTVPHGAVDQLLSGKPSIAVLAFTNMSGDLEQEYFSDGIADDIITELSRSRSLFVIARNSSFTYKGRAVDIKRVGQELGVRYVVEGSVRRSGGRVRVTAQLIETESGNHVWAERYDRDLSDVFAIQDEITAAIVKAILPAVSQIELQRTLRKSPETLGAWEAYQRGLWHMGKCNPSDNSQAQRFFTQAAGADASFAPARSALAMAILLDGAYGTLSLFESNRKGGERAREAIKIDPNDAEAHAIVALERFSLDDDERGLVTLTERLLHSPNAAWAHGIKGMMLVQLGRQLEGRAALLSAERLNPRDPSAALFRMHFAISYYYERDYACAVTAAKDVTSHYPRYPYAYRWLAAALAQTGQADEARKAVEMAMQISPEAFLQYVRTRPPWIRSANYEHMMEGLRKAGWDG
jgi:adenylate cyclase